MKKVSSLLLLSIYFTLNSYSQYHLGFNELEATQSISTTGKPSNITKGYTYLKKEGNSKSDKVLYYSWFDKYGNCDCFLYFDIRNISCLYIEHPMDREALNMFIEYFNSKFVKISSTEWNFYTHNKVFRITLSFNEEIQKHSISYSRKFD